MINFLQSNQEYKTEDKLKIKIMNDKTFESITENIKKNGKTKTNLAVNFINKLSVDYNTDKKQIIKNYFNFIIKTNELMRNEIFINFVENIMHINTCKDEIFINYFVLSMNEFLISYS